MVKKVAVSTDNDKFEKDNFSFSIEEYWEARKIGEKVFCLVLKDNYDKKDIKEELYDKIIPAFITTTNDTKEFLISDDIHISNSELPNEIVTLVSNDVKLGIAIRVTGHVKPIINKKESM